jgi:transposase
MAYDKKFRTRAVEYRKEGHTIDQTCEVFKIGSFSLKKWTKMYDLGEIEDKPKKPFFKKIDPVKLKEFIEENPDAYLHEIAEFFACSDEAIRKALKRLGITRKKRRPPTKNKTQTK